MSSCLDCPLLLVSLSCLQHMLTGCHVATKHWSFFLDYSHFWLQKFPNHPLCILDIYSTWNDLLACLLQKVLETKQVFLHHTSTVRLQLWLSINVSITFLFTDFVVLIFSAFSRRERVSTKGRQLSEVIHCPYCCCCCSSYMSCRGCFHV